MPTVALDIGHGSDTWEVKHGKGVVRNGRVYEEHDANSDTTLRTKALLEAHGIDVWLPQSAYAPEVELIDRTNEANRRGVDLYWSTHYNAGAEDAHGVCSFYWHTSETAQRLAEAYARNARDAGFDTHGNGTHASRPNSWTNLHVCRETHMTAVLTENGFMTNDHDFEGIFGANKDEYHQRIAEVHAKTICEFFGIAFDAEKVKHAEYHPKTKAEHITAENGLLQKGDRGQAVKDWQRQLRAVGYDIATDGIFGPVTEHCTLDFQSWAGITVDGIVGPHTRQAMRDARTYPGHYIQRDDEGRWVEQVQRKTNVETDGIYGPITERAVRDWQRAHGLADDGIVGPQTFGKMFG